jgi:hypothetical protein
LDSGCTLGGILAVLELIEDYKPAIVYDFRSRFHLGLNDLGTTVSWEEVVCLVSVLISDPTSWLQAAKSKWAHPIDYNWTLAAATYDLLATVNSKRKPKAWPRPWGGEASKKTVRKIRRDARDILQKARDGEIEWQNRHTPM